jgi:cytochrome c556
MTRQLLLALVCLLLAPVAGHAEHPADHHAPSSAGQLHLSPELTGLLQQEMKALQQGMQTLIPAIVSGNWQDIAAVGERIRNSYIMQQQLTDTQMAELHRSLPPAFRELDQSFHRAAGMLSHAAQQQNAEVVSFYFYKLTDTCVACHSKYAGHRFPGLSGEAAATGHRQ